MRAAIVHSVIGKSPLWMSSKTDGPGRQSIVSAAGRQPRTQNQSSASITSSQVSRRLSLRDGSSLLRPVTPRMSLTKSRSGSAGRIRKHNNTNSVSYTQGQLSPIVTQVSDNDDGTYTIRFKALLSGCYLLHVFWGSDHIHGSPFKIMFSNGELSPSVCNSPRIAEQEFSYVSVSSPGRSSRASGDQTERRRF